MIDKDNDEIKKELEDAKERIRNLERPSINEFKSEGTALVLSIILGLFGLLGIGHIYIGKKRRGVLILVGGLFLAFALFMLTVGVSLLYSNYMPMEVATVTSNFIPVYFIPFLGLYIWQIVDARRKCRMYNEYLEKNHEKLW